MGRINQFGVSELIDDYTFPFHRQVSRGPKMEGLIVLVRRYIEITVSCSGGAKVEAEDFDMGGRPRIA